MQESTESARSTTDGVVDLHGGAYQNIVGAMLVLCAVIAALPVLLAPLVGKAISIVPLVAFAVFAIRWYGSRVTVTTDGVVLRSPFRTHRLAWTDIATARLVAADSGQWFALVEVVTSSGDELKVEGVASGYRRSQREVTPARRVVELINARATG